MLSLNPSLRLKTQIKNAEPPEDDKKIDFLFEHEEEDVTFRFIYREKKKEIKNVIISSWRKFKLRIELLKWGKNKKEKMTNNHTNDEDLKKKHNKWRYFFHSYTDFRENTSRVGRTNGRSDGQTILRTEYCTAVCTRRHTRIFDAYYTCEQPQTKGIYNNRRRDFDKKKDRKMLAWRGG